MTQVDNTIVVMLGIVFVVVLLSSVPIVKFLRREKQKSNHRQSRISSRRRKSDRDAAYRSLQEVIHEKMQSFTDDFASHFRDHNADSFWSQVEAVARRMLESERIPGREHLIIAVVWKKVLSQLREDGSLSGLRGVDLFLVEQGHPTESAEFLQDLRQVVRARSVPSDLVAQYRARALAIAHSL